MMKTFPSCTTPAALARVLAAGSVALQLTACGTGDGADSAAACPDVSAKLGGTWHTDHAASVGLPLTLRFQPVAGDEGLVYGVAAALGFGDVPLRYGVADTCDAVLITDRNDNLVRTFPLEFRGEWLHLRSGAPNTDRYYWRDGTTPTGPATLAVKHLDNFDTARWSSLTGERLGTGYGALVGISALPDGRDFNGVTLREELVGVPGTDTCSPAINRPEGHLCTNGGAPAVDTFTFGLAMQGAPAGFGAAERNVLWDWHRFSGTGSLLHQTGLPSCTATCEQRFTLDGRTIGRFSVRYTLTRDDRDPAHPATTVTAEVR